MTERQQTTCHNNATSDFTFTIVIRRTGKSWIGLLYSLIRPTQTKGKRHLRYKQKEQKQEWTICAAQGLQTIHCDSNESSYNSMIGPDGKSQKGRQAHLHHLNKPAKVQIQSEQGYSHSNLRTQVSGNKKIPYAKIAPSGGI